MGRCDLSLVPVGIVFPSAKGGEESDYHTCQILTLAEKSWFNRHEPVDPRALNENGSRHAPPHVARKEQATYDEVKKLWADRLVALLQHAHALRHLAKLDVLLLHDHELFQSP